jgi:ABC-type multidrug transport system fused ATPase/permease subunit
MTAFIAVLMGTVGLGTMADAAGTVAGAVASAKRIFAVLDRKPKIRSTPSTSGEALPTTTTAMEKRGCAIRFDDVHFAYPSSPDHPVLRGVSFTVEPGRRVALVGSSGSGKTTASHMLLRFYDPTQGAVAWT